MTGAAIARAPSTVGGAPPAEEASADSPHAVRGPINFLGTHPFHETGQSARRVRGVREDVLLRPAVTDGQSQTYSAKEWGNGGATVSYVVAVSMPRPLSQARQDVCR
ncbi:hypothetical protein AB0M11_18700 [Streptomyces sp. NPDC051987]|uniref:hypothetical protein n=1 Tax=Streptomyces sp. NPDC051987 TaxID=3155808 RepID=UPI00342F77B6